MKPKELFIGALVLHEDQPCIVEHIEKAGLIGCRICGTKKYIWVAADSLYEVPLTPEYFKKLGLRRRLLSNSWRGDLQGRQVQVDRIGFFYKVSVHHSPMLIMTHYFVSCLSQLQAIFTLCGIEMEVEV